MLFEVTVAFIGTTGQIELHTKTFKADYEYEVSDIAKTYFSQKYIEIKDDNVLYSQPLEVSTQGYNVKTHSRGVVINGDLVGGHIITGDKVVSNTTRMVQVNHGNSQGIQINM